MTKSWPFPGQNIFIPLLESNSSSSSHCAYCRIYSKKSPHFWRIFYHLKRNIVDPLLAYFDPFDTSGFWIHAHANFDMRMYPHIRAYAIWHYLTDNPKNWPGQCPGGTPGTPYSECMASGQSEWWPVFLVDSSLLQHRCETVSPSHPTTCHICSKKGQYGSPIICLDAN